MVSCRCVDIHLQWEGVGREGRRDKGDKDADRWRRGILSSPPRFIFSETHWGPATRLSPACRNAALCGIFSSASPSVARFLSAARIAKSFFPPFFPFSLLLQSPLFFILSFPPFIVSSIFSCSLWAEGAIIHFPRPKWKQKRTLPFACFCKHLSTHGPPLNTDE